MSEQDRQVEDQNSAKPELPKINDERFAHDPVTIKKYNDKSIRWLKQQFKNSAREYKLLEQQFRNYDDGENYWVNKRSFLGILIITAFILVVSIVFVVITLVYKINQYDFLLYIFSFVIIVFSLLIVAFRVKLRKSLNI